MKDTDAEVLGAIFAARVQLAKRTEEEVVQAAVLELLAAVLWVGSSAKREGSFLWFCNEFDLDASAVRRAIRDRVS